ncbi:MAG: hypothetical protein MZV64_48455 [Ignavibacteriales bacterium]|nr:hypothetical protein [Ignavibacteriales bacterium]
MGLLMPGINRLYYSGGYWPERVDSTIDPSTCDWLSEVIHLVKLNPRPEGYDPSEGNASRKGNYVRELGEAGNLCWEKHAEERHQWIWANRLTDTFLSWRKMLPIYCSRSYPERDGKPFSHQISRSNHLRCRRRLCDRCFWRYRWKGQLKSE